MDFTEFLTTTYSESNSNDHLHTESIQMKLNKGTLHLDNYHQSFWIYVWFNVSLASLADESNSQLALARVSAGQCLKFCDETPSRCSRH